MDNDALTAKVIDAFERVLALLCGGPFQVQPAISYPGNQIAIGVVTKVTPGDEAALLQNGGEAALATLASIIGTQHAGVTISFQFE